MQDLKRDLGRIKNNSGNYEKNQFRTGIKTIEESRIFPRAKKFTMKRDKDGRIRLLKQAQANFFLVGNNDQEILPSFQFQ